MNESQASRAKPNAERVGATFLEGQGSMVTPARSQEPLEVWVKRVAEKIAGEQRGTEAPATLIERRSSSRSRSRGDQYRLSSPIVMNLIQAADILLLLAAGLLAKAALSFSNGGFSVFDKPL